MSKRLSILFAVMFFLLTFAHVNASTNSFLSVIITDSYGQSIADMPVHANNDNIIFTFISNQNGIVEFTELSIGDWIITVCGQTVTYNSVDGEDISAMLFITCHRSLLPIVSR